MPERAADPVVGMKVQLPWIANSELGGYRFLGRLRDLQGETPRALRFGGSWYPRSQMAHVAGIDGMEFWVKRWVAPNASTPDTKSQPA